MLLSRDEGIVLVLALSNKNIVSSKTTLNKLLARLNLHYIPIDVEFSLHRNGSYYAELSDLEDNELFKTEIYPYQGGHGKKFILEDEGKKLFNEVIKSKLDEIFSEDDFKALKEEIYNLSKLRASDISDDEHKKLLVDIEDRFKLNQRVNEVMITYSDLYEKSKKLPETYETLGLKALIEYSHHLAKYLHKKLHKLEEEKYDYGADMFDYYFLSNLYEMIPLLEDQLKKHVDNPKLINKFYQYLVNSVRDNYPFSLDNPDLMSLIKQSS